MTHEGCPQLVLDRDAARRRDPDLLAGLAEQTSTRLVVVDARGRVALAGPARHPDLPADGLTPPPAPDGRLQHASRLAPVLARDIPASELAGLQAFYIGRIVPADPRASWAPSTVSATPGQEEHWLAVVVPPSEPWTPTDAEGEEHAHPALEALTERFPLSALRAVAADLPAHEAQVATAAVALAAWHARARYCTRCGCPTRPVQAGWAQRCTGCGDISFPRTDPAVIMAVTDEHDRIVLVHGASWAPGRYSTVAGFVEAGESAQDAVVREVAEETGLRVARVEPVATQPWPYPRSLMLGYRAYLAPGEQVAHPDGEEVTDAVVLTRDELAQAVRAGRVVLPGRASIAYRLISQWFGADVLTL